MKDKKSKIGGFDVIGDIAVLPQYTKKAKAIAKQLLLQHKNIKTVVIKAEKVKGRLRKRKIKFLAGIKNKETLHKENSCLISMDIEDCYFSPRLSSDRLEIAKQVKKGEKVLVMFAGVAPYALVIAKKAKPKMICITELNRKAVEYAKENIKLNKINNMFVVQGDIKKAINKIKKKFSRFDRIVMPRPQLKDTFLKEAFSVAKKNTVVHFHDFADEKDIPDKTLSKIKSDAKKYRKKIKILRWKKAGDIAPHRYRLRVDFKVL